MHTQIRFRVILLFIQVQILLGLNNCVHVE